MEAIVGQASSASPEWCRAATRIARPVLARIAAGSGRGAVLSVHRTAVTVTLGGFPATIADASLGALPSGVSVPGLRPARLDLRPGDPVRWTATAIVIQGRVARLRVPLSAARPWSPLLGAIPVGPPGLRARLDVLSSTAARLGTGLSGEPFGRRVGPILAALDERLAAGDVTGAGAVGSVLVGLGPGLTPSGDDVLVGLTAALGARGDPAAGVLAGRWADVARNRTTEAAAAFHRHAAQGEYAERLHLLLRAVLAGPLAAVEGALDRAAAWGASSGRDLLLGVAIGLGAARDVTGALVSPHVGRASRPRDRGEGGRWS